MQLTGADPDAIAAFEQGVGASTASPTDALTAQGPLEPATTTELENTPELSDGLSL